MFKSIKTGHITLLLCMLSIGLNNLFFSQQFGQFIESSQSVYLPFTITNYNTKHGLPQNQVEDIVQKSNRELIIATANGIVAFDGTSFRNFINDKNHIESFYARVFCDKATNKLYGLGREQLFSQISPTYKPIKYFTAICQYQNRFFGITPKGTLYVCYPKNNKVIAIAQTNSKWVGGLHYDGKSFYIITAKQLIKFDYKSKETKTFKVERLHSVYRNPCNKQLYFVGYTNVFQIKKNSIQALFDKDKYSDFQFNDIEFTEDNEMYVATSKGLIYSGYGYTEVYDQKDMLPSENLRSLYYDEVENCLFVGSGNKGFFKFQLKNANTMSQYPDIGTSSLSSVVQTKNGNIYVCSSQHTLYEIGYDYARPICNVKASVASLSIIDNELWIGTWGSGIYRVKNDKIIDSITLPQLTTNVVHGAYKDSKGTIWVSNLHGLSAGKSVKSLKPVFKKEIKGQIITIFERSNGNILLGGADGVYEISKSNRIVHHYASKSGLLCKEVRAFYEDKKGKIWIGTYDGGLYCLNKGKITSINSLPNCMLSKDVFTIASGDDGMLYMTSNNGIYVVNENRLNEFYNKKLAYLVPYQYGNEAGILNTEFNGGFQNNYLFTAHKHFYFPSIEGLVTFTPEDHKKRINVPQIKTIRVDNVIIDPERPIFKRNIQSIDFDFSAASYCPKFNVHYQYKLQGPNSSNNWSNLQKEGRIRFSFLRPGEYSLKIRAIDGNSSANPKVISYNFTIEHYFYETWWFIIVVTLVIAAKIFVFVRYRIHVHRNKEKQANLVNNNIIELKLKAIQAKMNPHFIFNTLNNIQYLIVLDRKDEAEKALKEFATLLRSFLNQSDQSFVRLKDEMLIMDKYLQIEQIQFDGELNYEIDFQQDVSNWIIPTLLLQPVVENSIKHGLAHSNHEKHLIIRGFTANDTLILSVDDNGIGREASKSINSYRESHVSHGWKLVTEKIAMIKAKYGVNVTYTVIDKEEPETGTVVVFTISRIDPQLLNM